MKVTTVEISSDARNRLEGARADLQAALAARNAALARIEQVEGKKSSLADEIRKSRATLDALDDEAVQKFATRERQAELLGGEVERAQAIVPHKEREVFRAASVVAFALQQVLRPVYEERVDEVADVLCPFFQERALARNAALATDFAKCFSNRLALFSVRQSSIAEAQQLLLWVSDTLAGRAGWLLWPNAE